MRSLPLHALVPVLALVWVGAPTRTCTAQAGRAEITGDVRDESGAVVPGCKVTVTDVATNAAAVATTGPEGVFNIPYLQPGVYRISAEAFGLSTVGARGRAAAYR